MLGGGTFLTQNKTLPGAYINFVSVAKASASLSDRGIAAIPMVLDWGVDGAVFTVTAEDFMKNSLKIFGYDYAAVQMKPIRDLFKNITTGYFFKLMTGGIQATNTYCTAKYKGTRGNDLKTVVVVNADDVSKMDVSTYIGTVLVDKQTVLPNTNNLVANDYVTWKASIVITATAGLSLTTGVNGGAVTATEYQSFLDKIESFSFNALGCPTVTSAISDLFVAFAKRMRDTVGAKFQTVVFQKAGDYEGVVNVWNDVTDDTNTASAVYWVTGAIAGCAVNKSNTNKVYDGEYTINTVFKQSELEAALKAGKFMFHKVGSTVRVLDDINSFVTFTPEKSADFASNQTIRVLDQIANDIAVLFNTKYLGNVPNDPAGRLSLWNDIVTHHQTLQSIRAIEGFKPDDVTVAQGVIKKSVVVNDVVEPTNAMAQLYMTTIVA